MSSYQSCKITDCAYFNLFLVVIIHCILSFFILNDYVSTVELLLNAICKRMVVYFLCNKIL